MRTSATAQVARTFVLVAIAVGCWVWGPRYAGRLLPWRAAPNPPPAVPQGEEITVRVLNSRQEAVPHASVVFLTPDLTPLVGPLLADAAGRVRISRSTLPVDSKVTVRCSIGPLHATSPLTLSPDSYVTVRLPGSFQVRGRVVSMTGGEPLPDAVVSCGGRLTHTDSEGCFVLGVVPNPQFPDGSITLQTRVGSGVSSTFRLPWSRAVEEIKLEHGE